MRREMVEAVDLPEGRAHSLRPLFLVLGLSASMIGLAVWVARRGPQHEEEVRRESSEAELSPQPIDPNALRLAAEQARARAPKEPEPKELAQMPKAKEEPRPRGSAQLPKVAEVVEGRPAPHDEWKELAMQPLSQEPVDSERLLGTEEGVPAAAMEKPEESPFARMRRESALRIYERRLAAREEQLFDREMRLEAPVPSSARARAAVPIGDEPGGGDEGLGGLSGLRDLAGQMMEQSAAQSAARTEGGGLGGLGGLSDLARSLSASGNEGSPSSTAAQRLDFFRNGGAQLPPGYLMASVQSPLSPYELKMGTVIPGVLMTTIHSESPGQIKGQVSENVYDSAAQRHLLIPQGTEIVGTYSGMISIGQERVQAASVRLNLPNGDSLDLGGMCISDEAGAAGLQDQVDNHFLRRLGAALLGMSATVGYEMTAPRNMMGVEGAVHRGLGESILQLANDLSRQHAQIPPTLVIRAGKRFSIQVSKDIVFPGPYKDGIRHVGRPRRRPRGRRSTKKVRR